MNLIAEHSVGPLGTKTQAVIQRKHMGKKELYYILRPILKLLSSVNSWCMLLTLNQLNGSSVRNSAVLNN